MAELYLDESAEHIGMLRRARRVLRKVRLMCSNESIGRTYWPDEPRKSPPRILADLVWWGARHQEVNNYYFCCGLDRKAARLDDYVGYRYFRRIRDAANVRPSGTKYNYLCMLRDKFLFGQFLTSLGIATPRTLALLEADGVQWTGGGMQRAPLESLFRIDAPRVDGFCKPLDGIKGEGAFPLVLEGGRAMVRGQEVTPDALRAMLDGRYILQERIQQHPQMSALHGSSINTLRLITYNQNGRVTLFSASQRIGSGGKSVDNWAAGGLIVSIDPQSGEMRGDGYFKPGYGGRVAAHPDTGVRFAGYRIPHFQEAVELVTRVHGYLRGLGSVGWDVGISTQGPMVIEGNDDWEGGIPMVLEPDFKRRFLAMHVKPKSGRLAGARPADLPVPPPAASDSTRPA